MSSKVNSILMPSFDLELQRVSQVDPERIHKQLRIASLFFDEVIVSPSFILESARTQEILNQNKELLSENIVVIPLKEESLDIFIGKKLEVYDSYKKNYPNIVSNTSVIPLLQKARIIQRVGNIGESIDKRWLQELESSHAYSLKSRIISVFGDKYSSKGMALVSLLQSIPSKRNDEPFVWELIEKHCASFLHNLTQQQLTSLVFVLRTHLLGIYFDILTYYSDASVAAFKDINLHPVDNIITSNNLSLLLLENVLTALGVSSEVLKFTDWQIVEVKSGTTYQRFRYSFEKLISDAEECDKPIKEIIYDTLNNERILFSREYKLLLNRYSQQKESNLLISIFEGKKLSKMKLPIEAYSIPLLQEIIDAMPLTSFHDKILEIYNNKNQNTHKLFKEELNQLLKEEGGTIVMVENYNINANNIIKSAIGSNVTVNNYSNNQSAVDKKLDETLNAIKDFDESTQKRISDLIDIFRKKAIEEDTSSAQRTWNEIKVGIATSGSATGIFMATAKLLGYE